MYGADVNPCVSPWTPVVNQGLNWRLFSNILIGIEVQALVFISEFKELSFFLSLFI